MKLKKQIQSTGLLGIWFINFICLVFSCTIKANNLLEKSDGKIVTIKSVNQLKCEHLVNPLGIDIANPRLSWVLQDTSQSVRGSSQTGYQIIVARSLKMLNKNNGDLWNTGKIISNLTNGISYTGKSLKSNQILYWKVRVWDQNGNVSEWSDVNQWTMGILNAQDWSGAGWISSPDSMSKKDNSTFLLRRDFSIKRGLKRAILSICGLGQYEISFNGKTITESILNPGWTQYDKTCLYDTYDVTSLLQEGQNTAGILLSNGMYRVSKKERYAKFQHSFGDLQAIAKILLEYNDGSKNIVITDGKWKVGNSPMTFSNIYGGEDWDARKVQKNWDKPGFDESKWLPVKLLNGPGGALKGITHAAPPVRLFQTFKPINNKEVKPNITIYDLGQEASFISRFTASGPGGSIVKITPSELLNPDGTLFRNNYNGKSYSIYTLSGEGKESYTSKFFTTGCRFYQVESIPAPGSTIAPKIESIEGVSVHSDSPFVGEFSCSNELFNKTYNIIRWAELSNMKSVISDCPHRERLGWLEQDHLHGPSFRYNYDMSPLVGKIIHDMNDTQQENGLIPCIAPELTVFGPDWREAIEWGTSSILLPWQEYEWTGDVEVLSQNYNMMKRYVAFLTSKAKDGIAAGSKGDWEGRRTSPNTPKDLVATAFYYCNADVIAKSAKLLGNMEELNNQRKLANNIREAFNKKFFNNETKQYGTGSQCANALALVIGLVDSTNRQAVMSNLVADIENRQYENTTGEVGFRYVIRALADGGRSDIVYKMNNQSEKPGYGYQLKMGATALPETWDAFRDNSQNQFMLGHIIEWFYHDLAGIQLDPKFPGFKHIIIRPDIVGDLTEVKSSYNSIQGKIVSEWKLVGAKLKMHVVIPSNTTATIYFPSNNSKSITESGKPIVQNSDIKIVKSETINTILNVGSGDYTFEGTYKLK